MQTTLEAARRQIAYSQTGGSLERIVQRTERALLQEGSSGILSPASPSRIRLVSLDRRLGFLGRGTLRPDDRSFRHRAWRVKSAHQCLAIRIARCFVY
jgi:hypothetical protein